MKKLLVAALSLFSSIAFATTLNSIQLLNPAGSTAGQVISSTGPSSPPAWASVSFSVLPSMAANTLLGNATASTHAPTAVAVPSCSASGSVLQWTSGTGPMCATGYALTAGTAALAGSAAQNFSVKDATTANHAVAYDQVMGVGQTLTNVIGSRVSGATYTNSTGKPIYIYVIQAGGTGASGLAANVNAVTLAQCVAPSTGQGCSVDILVPAGATYAASVTNGTITTWYELR